MEGERPRWWTNREEGERPKWKIREGESPEEEAQRLLHFFDAFRYHGCKYETPTTPPVLPTAPARKRTPSAQLRPAEKRSEAYKRVPDDFSFTPPPSRHRLLQEKHFFDPWRVLIICMLLNNTTGGQVRKVLDELFALCPDAEATTKIEEEQIEQVIRTLGLQKKRATMIKRFSEEYLSPDWTHVTELHGVGKYAADAYAIFCAGKGADVRPQDHKLVDYWNSVYGKHFSASSSSSSKEKQAVAIAQPTPSRTITPQRTQCDDHQPGFESHSIPPIETPPAKESSGLEDSSNEEGDEEEGLRAVEKPKSPSPSKKLKQQIPYPNQSPSPSKKPASAIQPIWSQEDEMTLLRALSEYHVKHQKLPSLKDYASLLSGISGSIGFPVTDVQLYSKIRHMKFAYGLKKNKGPAIKFSNPHERAVFEMSKRLFGGSNSPLNKEVSLETDRAVEMEMESGGVANESESSFLYLRELISRQPFLRRLPSVEDMVARIGKSRAQDLDSKIKMTRIDALKLYAREENLKAELLTYLADSDNGCGV